MRTVVKTLLLWLMLLAIPAQGIAASAMLFCDTPQTQGQVSKTAEADHVGGMQHDPMAMADGAHADHAMADAGAAHDANHMKQGDAGCAVCAPCCLGAALLPTALAKPFISSGSDPIPFLASRFTGHIPAGIERPPHTALA
ncbi:hypothetical protein [Andreprevotia chitinilytica]|uniref:hypothetical protein n=1 Tax=Andreprevotia chitinilytica TaxID=396808 RepID=UPI000552C5F6|nr:hypothetical protein [Andreprevotia chitinilytica]